MDIRELKDLAQIRQVEELQSLAWRCPDREIIPSHLLHAGAHHGSCLLGGFEGDLLVGFVYAFPAEGYLYSQIAGVRPDRQGQGHGAALKRAQAAWAKERGYARIVWTFDPLQALNCHLNLHTLGAVAGRYLVDYYGELEDEINRGVPSDRVEADWWLDGRDRPQARRRVAYAWPLEGAQRREARLKLRETLQEAFAEGLALVDCERAPGEVVLWLG